MATLEGMGDLSLQGGTNQVERNLYEDLVRNVSRDVVSFSEREQQVLDLYETLQEFELERSMLEAQKTVRPGDQYTQHCGASADPQQCLLMMSLSCTTNSEQLKRNS